MDRSTVDAHVLDRECNVFCRYLSGHEANEYVRTKYREAHQTRFLSGGADLADAVLAGIACLYPWTAKIIDAYTRVFRPLSIVRKKLVILLAILETCAPTHAYVDTADSQPAVLLLVRMVQRCLTSAVAVLLAAVLLLPVDLILRGRLRRT
jgi:hypothetical protein